MYRNLPLYHQLDVTLFLVLGEAVQVLQLLNQLLLVAVRTQLRQAPSSEAHEGHVLQHLQLDALATNLQVVLEVHFVLIGLLDEALVQKTYHFQVDLIHLVDFLVSFL